MKDFCLKQFYPNFNVSFPTTTSSPTFHEMNVLRNDLKKDAINEFGIKIEHQTLYGSNFRNMGAPFI